MVLLAIDFALHTLRKMLAFVRAFSGDCTLSAALLRPLAAEGG